METEMWAVIVGSTVVLAIVIVTAWIVMTRSARLQDLLIEFKATQSEIKDTVQTRLSEVSSQLGDGLKNSDRTISEIRERLAVMDAAQKNLTDLSQQVVGLQDILSNKQARGAFGEVQLRDIVESLLPPSAYDFQVTLTNGKRADCVIRLPNPPGPIAVDSKFPLESYKALHAAENDSQRVAASRAFSKDVTKHINDISEKYILPGETAESALMFLPSEAVYAELHSNFPNVLEQSYRARVYIVSPTTMMATLNTVRAVLLDVRMREQAGVIQVEVQKMLEDVHRLDERVGKMQNHFNAVTSDINQIRTSTGKITNRGEAILEVELADEDQLSSTNAAAGAAPPKAVQSGNG
jgi:DNA recombination protein RmuC